MATSARWALGVVCNPVLPAAPDHGDPRSGQDTNGVRMSLALTTMFAIQRRRPRIRMSGVLGEVDQRAA